MAHTYNAVTVHVVFGTYGRRPWIPDEALPRITSFLRAAGDELGVTTIAAGGYLDHVHLLQRMPLSRSPASVVGEIKKCSSSFMSTEVERRFKWQRGYGAISVSPGQIDRVKRYILNQREHHRQKTFEEEFHEILVAAGVDVDPRYLWS